MAHTGTEETPRRDIRQAEEARLARVVFVVVAIAAAEDAAAAAVLVGSVV